MDDHLVGWLTTLDEDSLTRVLANRPDAIAAPWPRRLDDLAQRLTDDLAVMEVMRGLPLPSLELLQACLAVGGRPTRDELARFLGVHTREVLPWLDHLYDHALAWPGPGGRINLAGAVARWCTTPCGLGRPLRAYLDSWQLGQAELRRICRSLNLPAQGSKRQMAARVTALLSDSERLDALLGDAPGGTLELLDRFAWDGPVRTVSRHRFLSPGSPEKWALDRALLFLGRWALAEMPREVALALRGPDYRGPFTPHPPDLATIDVEQTEIECATSRTAPRLLDHAATLLENIDKAPLPLLKGGGVGAGEVARLAREIGGPEDEVRLLLEVAAAARLIAPDEHAGTCVPVGFAPDRLVCTDRFGAWRVLDAPARLHVLLTAWWHMERCPARYGDGRRPEVLGDDDPAGETIAWIRRAVFRVLAGLPEGQGFATLPELVQSVRWWAPMLDGQSLADWTPAILHEARLLGLAAGNALTGLGRALAAPASATPAPRAARAATSAPVAAGRTGRLVVFPGGRDADRSTVSLIEPPPDPREHARRLLGTAGVRQRSGQRSWAVIGRMATRLPVAQQSLLGRVVDRNLRAFITLRDGVTATISHGELHSGVLDAWCEEAGDYLEFPLDEIASVASTD